MPLYDYQCQQCKSGFTELRRTSEMDSPISCPECCSMDTRRSISCFSVGGTTSGMPAESGTSKINLDEQFSLTGWSVCKEKYGMRMLAVY